MRMFGRVINYAKNVLKVFKKIDKNITTKDYKPRAGCRRIFKGGLMMAICGLGSLNVLEQLVKKNFWEVH
jgi:hypothetical protein